MNPLYALIAVSGACHVALVGARLAVMLSAISLAASPVTVGVLAALFSLFGAITSVPTGRWIDRAGARIPMTVGAFGVVAGCALAFAWRDLAALFVASAVIGTSYNAFFIAQQRCMGQIGRPEDRVRNFSLASLGYSAASFVGPLLAGVAIDSAGHAFTFLLLALVALAPSLVLLANAVSFPPPEAAAALKPGAARAGVLGLLRDRPLARIFFVSVLAQSTWSIVQFIVPLYGAQIGLNASSIGLLMGAFSAATIVVRLFTPWLSRRFTSWQLMLSSLLVTALGFVGMPAAAGFGPIASFVFLMGLGLGLSGPIAQALVYEASPPARIGEVLGLRVTMMNVSHTAVPLLFGGLGTAVGVGPVFWVLAAILFAGTWLTRGQWRRAHEKGRPKPPLSRP